MNALVPTMLAQNVTRRAALLLKEVSKIAQVGSRMEWIGVEGSDLSPER